MAEEPQGMVPKTDVAPSETVLPAETAQPSAQPAYATAQPSYAAAQPAYAAALQAPAPLSGWKIGFAAGISFALTISLIAGLVWMLRSGSDWMARSQKQDMDAQQVADAPKVRPEYAKEVRALADAMKNEKATLTGDPAAMKKTEQDLETRISNLSSEAQTAHEMQISSAMWDVHAGVMSCIEDILYGGKPSTPASTCVEKMASGDEIEKAVNTPYTKY